MRSRPSRRGNGWKKRFGLVPDGEVIYEIFSPAFDTQLRRCDDL